MPPKKKSAKAAASQPPPLPAELVEQRANAATTAGEILDITTALKKALIERALKGERGHHLGYPLESERPESTRNQRSGTPLRTARGDEFLLQAVTKRTPASTAGAHGSSG